MAKEKTQYEKSRHNLLDDPNFNPTIEGDEQIIDATLKEGLEFLDFLIERIRSGEANVKITRNKKVGKYKLEIFQINDNKLVYFTDIPVDVLMTEKRIVSAGLLPEYVDE